MNKVECVITYPTDLGPFIQYLYGAIDNKRAEVALDGTDKFKIYLDDVIIDDGLIVYITFAAPPNTDMKMDILIDGVKFNKKSISPIFKPNYYEFFHTV